MKKIFSTIFSLDFPGVEVKEKHMEAHVFFEKKYYWWHFHHFSICNNYLIGQQVFVVAFCVFVSFREIFSGYPLMLRKQMVFNK